MHKSYEPDYDEWLATLFAGFGLQAERLIRQEIKYN